MQSKFYIGNIPNFNRHITTLKIAILIIVVFTAAEMFYIQIYKGSSYEAVLNSTNRVTYYTKAIRGEIIDRNGVVLAKDVPSFSLYITDEHKMNSAAIIKLSSLTGVSKSRIKRMIKNNTSKRILIKRLTKEQLIQYELNRLELKGTIVRLEPERVYPLKSLFAHTVGYVSRITKKQLRSNKYRRYDYSGKIGVEKMFESSLRGRHGAKLVTTNGIGDIIKILKDDPAINGKNVYLTIDSRLQEIVKESIKNRKGAIVAIEPSSGKIVAMYSSPTYNPNLFSTGITNKQWSQIKNNKNKPLINRAIMAYPPGSIFKIITAAAALDSGVINANTKIFCPGEIKIANQVFHDWKPGGFGYINIHRAIASSSDVFFYQLGIMVGAERIKEMAYKFGLGRKISNFSEANTGTIPSPSWKWHKLHEKWYLGNTAMMAVGQGYVKISPLQAASMAATIANGGYFIEPHIVNKKELKIRIIKKSSEEIIKSGMYSAVNSDVGTATRAKSNIILIAGKTGTAQVVSTQRTKDKKVPLKYIPDAWFISFAPYKNPKLAIAVFIENGGYGGVAAAPIAKSIYQKAVKEGII